MISIVAFNSLIPLDIIEGGDTVYDDKISNDLKILLTSKKTSEVDVIISFYSPPSKEDIRMIEELGGIILQEWSNLIYAIHAKLPSEEVSRCSRYSNIRFIEMNSNLSVCLDYSVRQMRVRPLVWNTYGYQGNSSQAIAILDTGVDDTHIDLEDKIGKWKDFTSQNYAQPVDKDGHGTHCAGIIAGRGMLNSKNYTTTLNDLSYFYYDIGEYGHRTYVTTNVSGNLTVKLRWDDDYEDGPGNVSIWVDIDQDNKLDPGEYLNGTTPLNFSISITPGRYMVAVTAVDYDAWLEDFYCQIDAPVAVSTDGHGIISGVAPNCKLAGLKILSDDGSGNVADLIDALEWLSDNARNYSIIVASMSIGLSNGEVNTALDNAVNNLTSKGVVCVVAAGNDQRNHYYIASPGTARKAITVGAVDDENALTDYSSIGDPSREVIKPDVLAPGGSWYTGDEIISADSNDADDGGVDAYPNDYRQMLGTSMACPHIAGLAALIIDALGEWNYTEDEVLKVKQLILMASYEIGVAENNSYTPPFSHGGKDNREGYGMVAADAAIEAATMYFTPSNFSLGYNIFDKKVWARKINLTRGKIYNFTLDVPSTGNFDLYLYNGTPNLNGEPILLDYSCNNGSEDENIKFTSSVNKTCYIIAKWRSGYGNGSINLTCKPLCNFSYTPINPTDLDTISFIDTSNDPDIVSWNWSFGDGNTSNEQNPTHRYADDGIYNVTLEVIDKYCGVNSSSKQIVVLNIPPFVDFNYTPIHPTVQDVIYFNDSSYDLDGYITNWTWSFGDGNISYLQNPYYKYNNNGIYNITITIKDDDDTINEITKQMIVYNIPPIVNFTYHPMKPTINQKIYFNDTTYDIDGYIVSWRWDFDDGNTSDIENTTHIYITPGLYNVTLNVTDNNGSYNISYKKLIVNDPPTANFTYLPVSPRTVDTIIFNDTSKDRYGRIINWTWDFDDGNIAYGRNVTHKYQDNGIYNVTLRVTDNCTAQDNYTKTIIVENIPPNISFIYHPRYPIINQTVEFNDTSHDLDGYIVNRTWDFNGIKNYSKNKTYIFHRLQNYNVTLIVRDDDNATNSMIKTIITRYHVTNQTSNSTPII
ncbi:MAG: hypothetical protein DRN12_07110, partial [Thermoplasmata archaeon]